eukprot:gene12086-5579_t
MNKVVIFIVLFCIFHTALGGAEDRVQEAVLSVDEVEMKTRYCTHTCGMKSTHHTVDFSMLPNIKKFDKYVCGIHRETNCDCSYLKKKLRVFAHFTYAKLLSKTMKKNCQRKKINKEKEKKKLKAISRLMTYDKILALLDQDKENSFKNFGKMMFEKRQLSKESAEKSE